MKVLVVNNMVPFVWGGAEELAHHLVHQLNQRSGVEAELLRMPFNWEPAERLVEEMFICHAMRLAWVDRVIALKFPAYLMPHEHKTLWLLHQYRQAYDLWDLGQSNIPQTPRGQEIRRLIQFADNACFESSRRIFVNSPITQQRLRKYNGFDSEILMPPVNDPERFKGGSYESYVFAGGRVNAGKRQHLLIEAMRYVRSDIKLIVGGPPDRPEDGATLAHLVERHNLRDRVALDLGFLPRTTVADYVNSALACAYLPIDEDSIGYVTMEAFAAGKAVITTIDSGGVLEIVKHGETGLVCEPDAKAIAEAISQIALDRQRTIAMGQAAKSSWISAGINWPDTIDRLLS